jgi:integrative and conjugative element protein (TIGR02256 family)
VAARDRDHSDVAADPVDITPTARDSILRLATESADGRETGGILLGRRAHASGVVCVEIVGDPGPAADRRPTFFSRDLAHANALAQDAWQRSRAVWVGEWHTHPAGGPQPSARDLATYAGLLAASALAFEVFVSIIVVPNNVSGWDAPQMVSWLLELGTTPEQWRRLHRDLPSSHGARRPSRAADAEAVDIGRDTPSQQRLRSSGGEGRCS